MDGTPLWCLFDSWRTTFLLCPLPFQRSTDSGGPDCLSNRHDHYWSLDHRGVPSIRLLHCCDYACDLSHINYAHSNHLCFSYSFLYKYIIFSASQFMLARTNQLRWLTCIARSTSSSDSGTEDPNSSA